MSALKPSFTTTNPNNISSFTEKKAKAPTFFVSASKSMIRFENFDDSLELLKISIKKQIDRRNKLKKLLEKYLSIYSQQKKHVKQIKSSIIEMKDANSTCKLKLFVDPSIVVDNSIKLEARQFLCTLMNTFYRVYERNESNNQIISHLNNTMSFLIKGISFNEDLIFMMLKTQINQQVKLEADLLNEKNRLKDELNRKKEVDDQYEEVRKTYQRQREKYRTKKQSIQVLEEQVKKLDQQISTMKEKLQQQVKMKNECQDKIDTQILYQEKLAIELQQLTNEVDSNRKQSKKLLKNLFDYRVAKCSRMQKLSKNSQTFCIGEQMKERIKFQLLNEVGISHNNRVKG